MLKSEKKQVKMLKSEKKQVKVIYAAPSDIMLRKDTLERNNRTPVTKNVLPLREIVLKYLEHNKIYIMQDLCPREVHDYADSLPNTLVMVNNHREPLPFLDEITYVLRIKKLLGYLPMRIKSVCYDYPKEICIEFVVGTKDYYASTKKMKNIVYILLPTTCTFSDVYREYRKIHNICPLYSIINDGYTNTKSTMNKFFYNSNHCFDDITDCEPSYVITFLV
ncbi:putative orfan [Tupanvirus soda lake]|uniref:Orfan n=2 Tax=Tupanvirus TaxID=2094720 RepID=A0AC62AB47_9VIRU|nr:putative orfan [Tupanvirus soda lake]QKU35012.1 putative orfan [Tupanvirus soda lake]